MFVDRTVEIFTQDDIKRIETGYRKAMAAYNAESVHLDRGNYEYHGDAGYEAVRSFAKAAEVWGKQHNQVNAQLKNFNDLKTVAVKDKSAKKKEQVVWVPKQPKELFEQFCLDIRTETDRYIDKKTRCVSNLTAERVQSIGRLTAKIAVLEANNDLSATEKYNALSAALITELNVTERDHNRAGCCRWFSRKGTRSDLAEVYMKVLRWNYIDPGPFKVPTNQAAPAQNVAAVSASALLLVPDHKM